MNTAIDANYSKIQPLTIDSESLSKPYNPELLFLFLAYCMSIFPVFIFLVTVCVKILQNRGILSKPIADELIEDCKNIKLETIAIKK